MRAGREVAAAHVAFDRGHVHVRGVRARAPVTLPLELAIDPGDGAQVHPGLLRNVAVGGKPVARVQAPGTEPAVEIRQRVGGIAPETIEHRLELRLIRTQVRLRIEEGDVFYLCDYPLQ